MSLNSACSDVIYMIISVMVFTLFEYLTLVM